MLYTDYHVHTDYSPDSHERVESYLIKAKKIGMDFVIFTDHADFGTNDKDFMELIDYDEYFDKMKSLEKKFNIPIKIGIEVGYNKDYKKEINNLLSKYPFEFVISSIHYGDNKDFYAGDFFHDKNQFQSYFRYFEILLEMVENFDNFDVVGHLDYIIRYGGFENKYYKYEEFRDIIDNILKTIIKKGKGIELNTSGLREETKAFYPKKEVLERYRELGGEIVTIGSDAHESKDYCKGIDKGLLLLKSIGFSKVIYFKKRRVESIKIV